jgi:hypothetical protein
MLQSLRASEARSVFKRSKVQGVGYNIGAQGCQIDAGVDEQELELSMLTCGGVGVDKGSKPRRQLSAQRGSTTRWRHSA